MSMFPTPMPAGDDPNRRWREDQPSDGTWPKALRLAWVCSVVAATLMLVTGVIVLTQGHAVVTDAPLDVVRAYTLNARILGWGDIVLAVAVAVCAAQLKEGSKVGRRWLAVFIAAALFLNVAGFIVSAVGLVAIVIVAFLAFAAMFAFRPAANQFIRTRTEERGGLTGWE